MEKNTELYFIELDVCLRLLNMSDQKTLQDSTLDESRNRDYFIHLCVARVKLPELDIQ